MKSLVGGLRDVDSDGLDRDGFITIASYQRSDDSWKRAIKHGGGLEVAVGAARFQTDGAEFGGDELGGDIETGRWRVTTPEEIGGGDCVEGLAGFR